MAGAKLYVSTSTMETSTQPDVCANEEPAACEPECLVQPRFFCGQLLTDQDLTALLNWNIGKYKLDRYKQGWGVVEGLQVQCDPSQQGSVLVNPGYAVDSCGNDIIVCEMTAFDISKACKPPHGHCDSISDDSANFTNNCEFDLPVSDGESYNIDIYIHYETESCEPQPALGRGACSEREACEFSRKKESFKLSWQYSDLSSAWNEKELRKWEAGYYISSRRIVPYIMNAWNSTEKDNSPQTAETMQAAFSRWFEKHPLHEFCFLKDAACNLTNDRDCINDEGRQSLQSKVTTILFWAIMDYRIAYLSKRPVSVSPDTGIPVARVKLLRNENDPRSCHVQYVDNMPPTRLGFSNDRWPAPTGKFNLGRLVWRQANDACSILRDKTIAPSERPLDMPQTISALNDWLDDEWQRDSDSEYYCGLFASVDCDYPNYVELITYSDPNNQLGTRVVSFRCGGRYHHLEKGEAKERPAPAQAATQRPKVATAEARRDALQARKDEDDGMIDIDVYPAELADIKGIGSSYEKKLHSIGIMNVEDLSKASVDVLQENFPRVSEEELQKWIVYAKEFVD